MSERLLLAVALLCGAGCECGPPGGPGSGGGGGGGGGSGAGPVGGGGGAGGGVPLGCIGAEGCYDGPDGSVGVGACRQGQRQCHSGALGACVGQVMPMPESCNGVDDDCNGVIDDPGAVDAITCGLGACAKTVDACDKGLPATCMPGGATTEVCGDGIDNDCDGVTDEGCGCAWVSAALGKPVNSGLDMTVPVQTIAEGISVAKAHGLHWVCIGTGAPCPQEGPPYAEAIEMVDGISLQGGYDDMVDFAYTPGCHSAVQNLDARGLHFGSSIQSASLDQLLVKGFADSGAGITLEGATGVTVARSLVSGGAGARSVGVRMLGGSEAVITESVVTGGDGKVAIGVESVASRPVILDNCTYTDPSRQCHGTCVGSGPMIRGRASAAGEQSIAVLLDDSPGATVNDATICAGPASVAAVGVWIRGHAAGTVVRSSQVEASEGGGLGIAVNIEHCAGTSPWVVDNPSILGGTLPGAFSVGVRIAGDCPARVDTNFSIGVGGGGDGGVIGVQCTQDETGAPSGCAVVDNRNIFNTNVGGPRFAIGVQCDPGACALVQGNRIDPGRGELTAGVVVTRSGPLVARNDISAGCPVRGGAGLLSVDSFARVENNRIQGATCAFPPATDGVRVLLAAGGNDVDLNSNAIGGEEDPLSCTANGLAFGLWDGGAPDGPRGLVRNNIIMGGRCLRGVAVAEETPLADPLAFENNDLVPGDAGVYLDEGTTLFDSICPVNVLAGSAANISADPIFDGGIHLSPGSPCRNAGTPAGAPPSDVDGDPRPLESRNDIGADEYRP